MFVCPVCERKYGIRIDEDNKDDFDKRWDEEFPDIGARVFTSQESALNFMYKMRDFK